MGVSGKDSTKFRREVPLIHCHKWNTRGPVVRNRPFRVPDRRSVLSPSDEGLHLSVPMHVRVPGDVLLEYMRT
jgi:hypothetical protein